MNPKQIDFSELQLPQPITDAITKLGFTTPTPVQSQTIPLVLACRDVISLAETGSGKTAAYLIPALANTMTQTSGATLILAPTRELAVQIADVFRSLTTHTRDIRSVTLIGGSPMFKQLRDLQRHPRFIIATPGRLMDHVRQRSVNLKTVTTLVLDEADRMFDMGFAPQVNEIIKYLPADRQTMLFSATFPDEIRKLASRVLRKPAEVEVRKTKAPPITITQKVLQTDQNLKNGLTLDLINAATGSVLIFTKTKHRTDRLARYLEEYGVKVTKIHGDRSQAQRNKSIQDFRSGEMRVLVATDIAARGLDVPLVSDVINYDLPMNAEDYVHRIGRTGRAGQKGQALTLITPHDRNNWAYIARRAGVPGATGPTGGGRGHDDRGVAGGRGESSGPRQKSGRGRDNRGAAGGSKPRRSTHGSRWAKSESRSGQRNNATQSPRGGERRSYS